MKAVISFLAICSIVVQVYSQCADSVNIYGFSYNNKYYEVVKDMKNWTDAAACAVERGGYLVEINDLNEQNAIYDAIINGAGVSTTYTSVSNGGAIAYVWIGATDQTAEGTWLWDGNNDGLGVHFWSGQGANGAGDGAAEGSAFFNWGGTSTGTPKEPDNYGAGQHHAAIGLAGWPSGSTMLGIAGEWNDIIGSSLLFFVIEYDSGASIHENTPENNKSIRLFPNPANDIFVVDGVSENAVLSFYDSQGKQIAVFYGNTANVSILPSGMYSVHVIDGENVFVDKVIVR
jgi:hypothetical protein